ncbi:MAG: guanylate kinase [Candidatus Peribacteria bacterium]|nr:guanylate kinase [Candidatus Peribacteria bacterium]
MEAMTQTEPKPGKLVLIIGPSGVGKSVILLRLKERHSELHFPRSATTRARRPREGNSLYCFTTDDEFDDLIAREKLLEWAYVHGGARYGTLVDEIIPFVQDGKIVIREVDVQGFDSIRHHHLFAGANPLFALQSIFILPENEEQLIKHITKRAPIAKEELERRMDSMRTELAYANLCDRQIINKEGKIDDTYRQVEGLIFDETKIPKI